MSLRYWLLSERLINENAEYLSEKRGSFLPHKVESQIKTVFIPVAIVYVYFIMYSYLKRLLGLQNKILMKNH